MRNACVNCIHFDGTICTKDLNNLDYSYVNDTMYKSDDDCCEDHELDPDYEEDE